MMAFTFWRVVLCLASLLAIQAFLYIRWKTKIAGNKISGSPMASDVLGQYMSEVQSYWHPPTLTAINNLSSIVNGTGVFGFLFDGHNASSDIPYGTYDWCNMPHVRTQEYKVPSSDYKLEYVEVIHRHHKRTPYAANTFPHEVGTWDCGDEALFFYGAPEPKNDAAAINWQVYTSPVNPLIPQGFQGTCQFPQISAGGLLDSRQHGKDLFGVYHDLLHFLPDDLDRSKLSFRVTNNQITSQVAGQVVYGMYPASNHQRTPVFVQPSSIDSLEPVYGCPAATNVLSLFGVGSNNTIWTRHLEDKRTVNLFSRLDAVSEVNRSSSDWHNWFDHYFDNLSARLCHQKPLPCNANDPDLCVTREDANAVFRRGEYEYSFLYRDSSELFYSSVASYGIWMAELAANLRNAMAGSDSIIYRHNVAHDGSISRLLSILQVNIMYWPGMGSEVIFELYRKDRKWLIRVLWGGQIFESSHPELGKIHMIPVENLLTYIDRLVGVNASKIRSLCGIST